LIATADVFYSPWHQFVPSTMIRPQYLLPAMLVAGAAAAPLQSRAHGFAPLRFTAEGTFQITVFNDLHYGEGTQSSPSDHQLLLLTTGSV
jgi:hypothetical protein